NIIMIGPTGVGKTEIARRLARMTASPFLKVEASKYTEVGYVGRDVESIIRDLAEVAVELIRRERSQQVRRRVEQQAEDRPPPRRRPPPPPRAGGPPPEGATEDRASYLRTREKLRDRLRAGEMEHSTVELEVPESRGLPLFKIWTGQGMEEMNVNLK